MALEGHSNLNSFNSVRAEEEKEGREGGREGGRLKVRYSKQIFTPLPMEPCSVLAHVGPLAPISSYPLE